MIFLPAGWMERTEWDSRSASAVGRLGVCSWRDRAITYYPRWWLAPAWPLILPLVMAHERGHAWGIPDSGCLAGRRDCLMSEEADGKDSWWGKAQMWPRQALRMGRPCPACEACISKAIERAACR